MTSKRRRRRLRGKMLAYLRRAEDLARMKARAWEAPADYRFDRAEANERNGVQLLPAKHDKALVTVEIVNALRDELP